MNTDTTRIEELTSLLEAAERRHESLEKAKQYWGNAYWRLREVLADNLCRCGYVLPSKGALDPQLHSCDCSYRQALESTDEIPDSRWR